MKFSSVFILFYLAVLEFELRASKLARQVIYLLSHALSPQISDIQLFVYISGDSFINVDYWKKFDTY
jgi:hypothetical protein